MVFSKKFLISGSRIIGFSAATQLVWFFWLIIFNIRFGVCLFLYRFFCGAESRGILSTGSKSIEAMNYLADYQKAR